MDNHNVFAGAFVDRIGERRKDSDWLAKAVSDENSRFVPVWGVVMPVDRLFRCLWIEITYQRFALILLGNSGPMSSEVTLCPT